jgi:hypothetical protein
MTLSVVIAIWTITLPSGADSRKAIVITSPGQNFGIRNTGVTNFATYSYGLGAVGRASGGGATGILSTSTGQLGGARYANPGTVGTGRPQTGTVGAHLPTARGALAPPRGLAKLASGTDEIVDRGGDLSNASADLGISVIASAMSYIQSVGTSADLKRAASITTLVPAGSSGLYHDFMENGEKAFHSGFFLEAMQDFRNANHVGIYDPESLLSLAHAHFAMGQFATAGVYLAQAIERLPELPLLPIKPRSFYGNSTAERARYGPHMEMLRAYLQRQPNDAEAHLLLAYFLWFNQDDDSSVKAQDIRDAKQSLADGLASGRKVHVSKDTTEAIETFWDAMVASGQGVGRLEQQADSSTATAPASDAGKASTQPAQAASHK